MIKFTTYEHFKRFLMDLILVGQVITITGMIGCWGVALTIAKHQRKALLKSTAILGIKSKGKDRRIL